VTSAESCGRRRVGADAGLCGVSWTTFGFDFWVRVWVMLCTVVSPRGRLVFVWAGTADAIRDLEPADEPDPDPCREAGGDGSGSLRFSVKERFELI
jgi:hypothetical protein